MKKLLNKKVIAASVLAMATIAGAASARLSYETEFTYYDDNGAMIGSRLHACNGSVYTWGTTSDNYDIVRDRCF